MTVWRLAAAGRHDGVAQNRADGSHKAAGKLTLKHGPIKKLDMDGMTMVFRVADSAMLDRVKAGDRIEFEADRVNGAITETKFGKGH